MASQHKFDRLVKIHMVAKVTDSKVKDIMTKAKGMDKVKAMGSNLLHNKTTDRPGNDSWLLKNASQQIVMHLKRGTSQGRITLTCIVERI